VVEECCIDANEQELVVSRKASGFAAEMKRSGGWKLMNAGLLEFGAGAGEL
jgi:hypothetical protein